MSGLYIDKTIVGGLHKFPTNGKTPSLLNYVLVKVIDSQVPSF